MFLQDSSSDISLSGLSVQPTKMDKPPSSTHGKVNIMWIPIVNIQTVSIERIERQINWTQSNVIEQLPRILPRICCSIAKCNQINWTLPQIYVRYLYVWLCSIMFNYIQLTAIIKTTSLYILRFQWRRRLDPDLLGTNVNQRFYHRPRSCVSFHIISAVLCNQKTKIHKLAIKVNAQKLKGRENWWN